MSGYSLSDDADNQSKWTFPAGTSIPPLDSIVVFASGLDLKNAELDENGALHTSFRLEADGEYIGLADGQGTIVSQYAAGFPAQMMNVSYGIFAGATQYMPDPTPGQPNRPGLQGLASPPSFSVASHTFTEAFAVELLTDQPNAVIRFTTDGSVPDATSTLYTEPLAITASTEIRARTFAEGLVPSETTGESYIRVAEDAIGFSSNLPIVIIENFGKHRAESVSPYRLRDVHIRSG